MRYRQVVTIAPIGAGLAGLVLFLAAGGSVLGAPPQPDGSVLQPYTNLWQVTVTKADGTAVPVASWSDVLTRVVVDGKPAYKRVQVARFESAKLTRTFGNVFAADTMLPISSTFSSTSGEAMLRRFDGPSVWQLDATGENQLRPVESRAAAAAAPYDFNGGMYCLLVATYPLTAGLAYTIPAIGEFKTAAQDVPVRVLGPTTIEGKPGTTVSVWQADATVVNGDGTADVMHCYVTRQPPYVIRLVYDTAAKQRFVYAMW
ncbi:MAG TPA: hypothetical protein VGC96_14565 [Candidatus Elarobacter sp.]|jgi:hypothetical protein